MNTIKKTLSEKSVVMSQYGQADGQLKMSYVGMMTMLSLHYTQKIIEAKSHRCITLPNDVQAVPRLGEFVDEICELNGMDMATTMQMNLAIEEAVVNVMNYAYPQGTQGEVHVESYADDTQLTVVISDSGTPFDPTAKADVDTTLSAAERPIGGLGIYLVRQLMDAVSYERINGLNVLTLSKQLKK